ncbi:unnamed protein product [Phaedon cochleariae]|uniref:Dpy-30-like protein n=1 Tax=Phaedon cochleariae TaxID=80249 RepID=A0A9P0GP81_PHACE|nr:unnamed protein product [Phaedon cochleariae]
MAEEVNQDIAPTEKALSNTGNIQDFVGSRSSDNSIPIPYKELDGFHPTTLTEEEIAAEVCHLAGDPMYCKIIKSALRMENQANIKKKSQVDLASLPTKQYLDHTVVPILMTGLAALAKERPPDPILALAAFLLKHKEAYEMKSDELTKEKTEKSGGDGIKNVN